MAIQIRPTPSQISDLRAITELGSDTLNLLAERIETADPSPFSPHDLNRVVAETISGKTGSVDAVMRQLLSFASLRRRRRLQRA